MVKHLRQRRDSNYPSFEKSLDLDFGKYPPENKRELSLLMMNLKYHVIKNEKQPPTKKQLDYSWDYLVRSYNIEQKKISDYYVTEQRKTYHVHRATRNIYVYGKMYKKGQFLPRKGE